MRAIPYREHPEIPGTGWTARASSAQCVLLCMGRQSDDSRWHYRCRHHGGLVKPIPVVFHLGPLQIHTYGVGLAVTFWFAYRYFAKRLRDHGYPDTWFAPRSYGSSSLRSSAPGRCT